jgi:hypothetical protein
MVSKIEELEQVICDIEGIETQLLFQRETLKEIIDFLKKK